MTHAERIRDFLIRYCEVLRFTPGEQDAASALDALLAETRLAAIEECAAICDEESAAIVEEFSSFHAIASNKASDRIRALDKEPEVRA